MGLRLGDFKLTHKDGSDFRKHSPRKNRFWCTKCGKWHINWSKLGNEHKDWKE